MSILNPDEKKLIVAMDHARMFGVIDGLEDPGKVIDIAVEAGADAVMTTYGVVKHYRDRLIGRIPTILRLDGGPSIFREDWLEYSEYRLLHAVEDALDLGVDAVVVMAFIGIPVELETLATTAKVASECRRVRLPLLVEALPCQSDRIPDPKAPEAMASAARLAFEHGADAIKSYYTGDQSGFRQVIDNCPVPILIAGGPKMETDKEVLQMVQDAIQSGSNGVVFGRNIWQGNNPKGMIRALQHVIQGRGSVDEALKHLAGK